MRTKRPFTKIVIDARKTMGLTRDEASALLSISPSTLEKYERDEVRINSDIVAAMAQVYHDPTLRTLFCEHECRIGQTRQPCQCTRSIESIMLDLLLADRDELRDTVADLREIIADGIIDEDEEPVKDRCLNYLDKLSGQLEGLKLAVQKMDAQR